MTSLLTRLLRRHPRTAHLTFTVYSRAQCCCCHKALDVLQDAQRRFGFAIEEVDMIATWSLISKIRYRGAGCGVERQGPVPGCGQSPLLGAIAPGGESESLGHAQSPVTLPAPASHNSAR